MNGRGSSKHPSTSFAARRRRSLGAILASLLVVLFASVVAAQPAAASGTCSNTTPQYCEYDWTNHAYDYLITKDVFSTPLNMCFHLILEGTVKYQTKSVLYTAGFYFRNFTLTNPEVSVYTKSSCARTAGFVYTAKGADLSQSWYDYDCNVTPSIGVGYPWSIKVGVTQHCGNENLAYHKTTPRATGGAEFAQYNSGSPATWKVTTLGRTVVCLTVSAAAVVYKGSSPDSVTLSESLVCIRNP